ncbi:MAG: Crp/Fnr family transcriptional regulator [Sphingomicrobium sp.]
MTDRESPPGSPLEPLLRKLEYRVDLDSEDRAALLALPHSVKLLEQHDYIVRDGQPAECATILLSGYCVRHKLAGNGHRQIVAIHMKGEPVDLQNSLLKIADHNVQMLTSGKVAVIPRDAVIRIAFERPAIGKAMWYETLVDGSIFREWIMNVERRDARTRISHLLCEFSLRLKLAGLGERTNYELPMTQEQLADATGLTPVHVNRTIKSLEADGLIDRTSARSIVIGDWRKLADTGDFQSAYLHLNEGDAASV